MKTLYSKTKHFIRANKWWSALIGFVLIVICILFFGRSKAVQAETVTVQKQTIIEEVSTTGNVKPLSDINLGFEIGGRVSNIAVSVGQKVYQGQYLASVSNGDLAANVAQAQAGLKIAQANLITAQHGTRPEQLAIAQATLLDSQKKVNDSISDAYTKSDDAIHNNVDQMFNGPKTNSPTLAFDVNDFQLQNDIAALRYNIESMLVNWSKNPAGISANIVSANLSQIKIFLDKVAFAVNALSVTTNTSQTTIDKYKAAVSSARTSVNLAISNLTISQAAYNNAKTNLDLSNAGSTQESLDIEEAAVEQAQASLDGANAQLAKSIIRSPIEGVITNIVPTVGESVSPGATAISVISYGAYEVESFVPEADIARISIGDMATTTLDAYGSNTFFQTQVIKIDPAETVVEGVPTYKVTLKFIAKDDRIKSGMTANLDILTNTKSNVLAVPARAVYSSDTKRMVKVVDPKDIKKTTEQEVTTGIRGVDGYIEITSGLKLGDLIISSPNI